MSLRSLTVFLALLAAPTALAAIAADEVKALPGWGGPLPSKQYSGYLQISSSKFSHYWFVEAETNPASAPVFLWLNGGPGCSSLDGYLYEQGPFHVNETDHTRLYYNEYTWAKEVNIVFLESPVGVGFSYSTDPSDYRMNDTSTANDNFHSLQKFFEGFPEYKNNDFYVSGESYAGVYVPTLAARIRQGNANGESNFPLKGIAVGNGCTGNSVGICGGKGTKIEKDFLAGHSLVSPTLSAELDAACGDYNSPDLKCDTLLGEMSAAIGNIDIYNVYGKCVNSLDMTDGKSAPPARAPGRRILGGPDGCIDEQAASPWLNSADVQQAIHVADGKQYFKEWSICSSKISYDSTEADLPKTVYPDLVKNIKVLIFNGDVDACVPMNDNFEWTTGMGYPIANDWHPWSLNKQVAGYAVEFSVPDAQAGSSFNFITVHDSGHMVPQYQPARALEMLHRFVNDQKF